MYVQVPLYRTTCVGCSGATISGGPNATWQPSMLDVEPSQKLMQLPQNGLEYIQGSLHNILHANKNAVQAKNYDNVMGYNREFAARLQDNVAWLARIPEEIGEIQEEIGECNKKLDQLLKPSEPWYNFRTRWHGPAPQGK